MAEDGPGPRQRPDSTGRAGGRAPRGLAATGGPAARGSAGARRHAGAGGRRDDETPELSRLRRRIDALDRRLVALLNERAELGREVGRSKAAIGRLGVRDVEREREVLLRASMANEGPLPQADLLSIYRRIIAATRALEARDRGRAEPPDEGR